MTRRKTRPLFAVVAVMMAVLMAFTALDARVLAPAFANEGVTIAEDAPDGAQDLPDDAADVPAEPQEGEDPAENADQPDGAEVAPGEESASDARAGPQDAASAEDAVNSEEDPAPAAEDETAPQQVELVSSTVTFYGDEAAASPAILERRLVTAEAGQAVVVDVSGVSATPPTSAQQFAGWRFAGDVHVDEIVIDPRDGDVDLYPAFDSGHWLRFDPREQDATHVPSRFVAASEGELTQLDVSARPGYAFAGWFSGVEEGGQVVFGDQVSDGQGAVLDPAGLRAAVASGDVALYAKWTGEPTTYRVAIWHQNPDDDLYSFQGYDVVGDEDGERAISGEMTAYATATAVPGFTAREVEQAPIAGDGSTVLSLFYDRQVYEVKFHQGRSANSAIFDDLTISARYGADIHGKWPRPAAGETRYTSAWYTLPDASSEVFVTGIGTMPLGGARYYAKTDAGKHFSTVFMLQSVDGTDEFSLYEAQDFTTKLSPWTTADDYKPIKGFTVNAASDGDAAAIRDIPAGDKGAVHNPAFKTSDAVSTKFEDQPLVEGADGVWRHTVHLYYLRLQYDIVFEERGGPEIADAKGIYYEASLTESEPSDYVVGETSYTAANGMTYRFAGWYGNDAFEGEPFDFAGTTMPAGNLVLYAKWVPADYLVQVDPDGGEFTDASQSTYFRVQHGDTIRPIGVERHYVADPDGAFVYDYETASSDDDGFGQAVYVQAEAGEAGERYRYSEDAYSLYGWYHADASARASGDPFDFSEPIVSDTSIVARWRAAGTYDIVYNPVAVQDGDTVSGQIDWTLDEGYADLSPTFIMHTPGDISSASGEGYSFVGWQVVEGFAEGAEVLDAEMYVEGDGFVVDSELARDNVIHLQAVYEVQDDPAEPSAPAGPGDPASPESSTPAAGSGAASTAALPLTGDGLLEALPALVVGIALAALALALAARALRRESGGSSPE